MSGLGRYFHTVRHLRPIQIAGGIWFKTHRPRPDLRAAPPLRHRTGVFELPTSPEPTLIRPGVFRFLNVERECAGPEAWKPRDVARLWVYNLHYFDDLNARDSSARGAWHADLLDRWVAENPPGRGAGWEPYPLSRRIVNWVKWAVRGHALSTACRQSLAVQARWLMSRLEYHLLGNHLLANAKALMFAGLYFDGEEAERWLAKGEGILERQLPEQVLRDGGHFELSTMYHALVLEDLLDLINLWRAHDRVVPNGWLTSVDGMRRWLEVMCHPDGKISFFNDAAFEIAPSRDELEAYAERLDLDPAPPLPMSATVVLETSGYVRSAVGPAYLLCDCAPIGPDYLPAHAHADTLSFELSLHGQRIFVNSGTSQYGDGVERHRERSTPAHNTVVLDGQDSSEVWGGFRTARRARSRLHSAGNATPVVIEASHDGYRRLPGRNHHRRHWRLDEQSLEIEDVITGSFRSAEAYFHLHPDIEASVARPNEISLTSPAGTRARLVFDDTTDTDIRADAWHPRFGLSIDSRCVVARIAGPSLRTRVLWDEAQ